MGESNVPVNDSPLPLAFHVANNSTHIPQIRDNRCECILEKDSLFGGILSLCPPWRYNGQQVSRSSMISPNRLSTQTTHQYSFQDTVVDRWDRFLVFSKHNLILECVIKLCKMVYK